MDQIRRLEKEQDLDSTLKSQDFLFVLWDFDPTQTDSLSQLQNLTQNHPDTPIIITLEPNEVESAINCIRLGVYDYLIKPLDTPRLIATAMKARDFRELRSSNNLLKYKEGSLSKLKSPANFSQIITQDPNMFALFRYAEALAPTEEAMMILGEPGVGKELVARTIHGLSGCKGPFVSLKTEGMDNSDFEEALYGSAMGEGALKRASGGTLLIAGIESLSKRNQATLLKVMNPQASHLPQASYPVPRILYAAGQELAHQMEEGNFRRDLYQRLMSYHLHIPPLRQRKGDMRLLVESCLKDASQELGKKKPTVPKELYQILKAYPFPGNVRELRSLIYKAVSQHRTGMLSISSFKKMLEKNKSQIPNVGTDKIILSNLNLHDAKFIIIKEAMERSNRNQTIAAKMLGFSRQALNQYLKTHQI